MINYFPKNWATNLDKAESWVKGDQIIEDPQYYICLDFKLEQENKRDKSLKAVNGADSFSTLIF